MSKLKANQKQTEGNQKQTEGKLKTRSTHLVTA